MEQCSEVFVGIDVAKMRNAIAVADGERGGEVRYLGEVDAAPESMRRLIKRLAAKHERVHFCYEAGPTGYGLYRLITDLGHLGAILATPSGCDLTRDLQAKIGRARHQLPGVPRPPRRGRADQQRFREAAASVRGPAEVTNGYRAMWAAEGEATIRTVVDTARLAGRSPFSTILTTVGA